MKNIEIKAKCINLEALKETVAKNEGKFDRSMRHIDTYFNVSKGRLKLREIDGVESFLIYYERLNTLESKESSYQIYKTSDPASLKNLLSVMFGIKVVVDKKRDLYFIKNTRIHL